MKNIGIVIVIFYSMIALSGGYLPAYRNNVAALVIGGIIFGIGFCMAIDYW